jgi:hypothetical protein
VGIVNLDQGVVYRDSAVNVERDLRAFCSTKAFSTDHLFSWPSKQEFRHQKVIFGGSNHGYLGANHVSP